MQIAPWLSAAFLSVALSGSAFAQAQPVAPTNQASKALAITPSDTVDLPGGVTLGLYNGAASACNIAMILEQDTASLIWSNVATGITHPWRVKRVLATGTTCTGLRAAY
jgi:hypothetical protein